MSPVSGSRPRPARPASTAPSPLRRLASFGAIGGAGTVLQLGLFALLQVLVPVVWATVVAWSVSTVVSNQLNRSLTFGVRGLAGAGSDFGVTTGFSVVSLAVNVVAQAQVGTDRPTLSIIVLIGVNAVVGLFRFVGLRRWFEVRIA